MKKFKITFGAYPNEEIMITCHDVFEARDFARKYIPNTSFCIDIIGLDETIKDTLVERTVEEMPFDMAFETKGGNRELCSCTGVQVLIDSHWWYEYEDSYGDFHYGNP